ncbi:MAG: DUF1329 domain-containing protein [Proteobacteria bacterium]|nr:MAG: DUF1329 domain-containing protein [Pseudomonadota bacterium]
MHIRKYDFDYSRRHFMEKTALGVGGAGVLCSLWPEMVSSGESTKAYPEELLSIEAYTKGKVKTGDEINADNIDLVQDLVDPILYQEVAQDGRTFWIQPDLPKIEDQFPPFYLDATIKNNGLAAFDGDGNVVVKATGEPWIGGHPFPEPKTGWECIANLTLSWGRHDQTIYTIPTKSYDPEGTLSYEYDFVWCEQQCTGLTNPHISPDRPYLKGHKDKTRFQSVWFTRPNDVKGTAFLNIWHYDQREFPDLFGYLPAFKRVRRFPTNQRFEPLVAGMNLFLSDAWAAGDPMLTWGNFKIIARQPMLCSMNSQWLPDNDNWTHPTVGGPKGDTYLHVGKQLIPEVIIFEGEPTGFPRAPVSKRRVYVDARNNMFPQSISYDRRGDTWKSFEPGFATQKTGSHERKAADGRTEWTWSWVISNDIQSGRVTHFHQSHHCAGGWTTKIDPGEDFLNNYMTVQAMRRLGT